MVVDFVYKFKIDFDHYIPTNDNIRKVIKKSVKIQNLRNGVLGLTLTPTSSHKLNQFLIFKYFKFDGYTPQINLTKINKISKQGDYEEKHLFKLLECVIVHEHLHSLIWKEVKSNFWHYFFKHNKMFSKIANEYVVSALAEEDIIVNLKYDKSITVPITIKNTVRGVEIVKI